MSTTDPTLTAAADPLTELTTGQLETELLGMAGHVAAAQCRFLQLLAEFDRRGGWTGPGLKSCAQWLCWRIGMSLRTAAEHVRVAHALADLPSITEAFAAGQISYSKVRAITRLTRENTMSMEDAADPTPIVGGHDDISDPGGSGTGHAASDQIETGNNQGTPTTSDLTSGRRDPGSPVESASSAAGGNHERPVAAVPSEAGVTGLSADAEQTLLALALTGTASHVEAVVRATRRRQADPQRAVALRTLSWHHADDGSVILRGRFAPDEGALLVAAVEALVSPRRAASYDDASPPSDWRQRAHEQAPGAVADRAGARRADALLALVTGTAPVPAADEAAVARGQAHLIVHIDATTGEARIDGGPEIASSTAELLSCDATAQVLLEDTGRNRLYLGRSRRLASPAQIAALTVLDGGRCRFPGCDHTRHLHAHHVRPWLRGGRTDIDNLVLVCGFHHRLIHDRGYLIRRAREGGKRWTFHRPDGTPVPATGPPLTGNTESLIEIHTRAELRITRDSLTPTWTGERLDPAPLLDRLLPRTGAAAA